MFKYILFIIYINMDMNTCCKKVCKKVCKKSCIKSCVSIFKTFLSKCNVSSSDNSVNSNYTIITFDITLINKSKNKITNVSLNDAITGLQYIYDNISFDLSTIHDNLTPLSSDQIISGKGELLDTVYSYLPPNSASRLILKITVNQTISINCTDTDCLLNICYNSLTMNSTVMKMDDCNCTYVEEKMEPINIISKAS
jgi:hypothetical protein